MKEWDKAAVDANTLARAQYLLEAYKEACAPKSALVVAATRRGWHIYTDYPEFHSSLTPENSVDILRVDVSPPIPFGKEDGEPFHFDAAGCLIRRAYD
ncbi:MAG: hypothetical protein AAF701_03770 [Pseudomonadota bacterium]